MNFTGNSIFTNALWLLIARFLALLGNLGIAIFAARLLGESAFGRYSEILAVVSVLAVFATFGMDIYLMKVHSSKSRNPNEHALIAILLQGILVLVIVLTSLLLALWIEFFSIEFLLLVLILVPGILSTTLTSTLKGHGLTQYLIVYHLGDLTLQVIGLVLIYDHLDLIDLILMILIAKSFAAAILYIFTHRKLRLSFSWSHESLNLIIPIIKSGGYVLLSVIAFSLFQKMGILSISISGTDREAGLFGAANRLVEVMKIMPGVIYTAMFPSMVRDNLGQLHYDKRLNILIILFVLFGLLLFKYSNLIIESIYNGYEESGDLLCILLLGLLPFFVRQYWSFKFFAAGYEQQVAFVNCAILIMSFPVLLIAYSHYGLIGTCWGINLMYTIELGVFSLVFRRVGHHQ